MVHRDIKPANIFFGEHLTIKIGDFGTAVQLENETAKRYNVCGTPNYVAPEVLEKDKWNGHSKECDIWSLGVIAF